MITRIELINFMSHRHTVIEPAEGLTVLSGPNNCGKSAVITALQILAHNENSTYVTRHGKKKCSVAIRTAEGHEIVWQRKNGSTSYTIDGKLFDRLQRNVPQELQKTLRLPKVDLNTSSDQVDIHFGVQKQPVFLLNEPGRTAAGFFAASSDASRLIEMQRLHKDNVRSRKQDAQRLSTEIQTLQQQVDKLLPVESLADKLKVCEQTKRNLVDSQQRWQRLRASIENIRSLQAAAAHHKKLKKALDAVPPWPNFAPTQMLANLVRKIEELSVKREKLSKLAAAAEPLCSPPVMQDTRNLQSTVSELRRLDSIARQARITGQRLALLPPVPEITNLAEARKIAAALLALHRRIADLSQHSKRMETSLRAIETDIQSCVKNNPTCPTCRQPLDHENVLRHLRASSACLEGDRRDE